jgi:mRNA-degrading endonuclease toxin of MazEF toxin-antitoxin module
MSWLSSLNQLVSLQKSILTNFVGTVSAAKMEALNQALIVALDLAR